MGKLKDQLLEQQAAIEDLYELVVDFSEQAHGLTVPTELVVRIARAKNTYRKYIEDE